MHTIHRDVCSSPVGVFWTTGVTGCGVKDLEAVVTVLPRSEEQLLKSVPVQRSRDRPTNKMQSGMLGCQQCSAEQGNIQYW